MQARKICNGLLCLFLSSSNHLRRGRKLFRGRITSQNRLIFSSCLSFTTAILQTKTSQKKNLSSNLCQLPFKTIMIHGLEVCVYKKFVSENDRMYHIYWTQSDWLIPCGSVKHFWFWFWCKYGLTHTYQHSKPISLMVVFPRADALSHKMVQQLKRMSKFGRYTYKKKRLLYSWCVFQE